MRLRSMPGAHRWYRPMPLARRLALLVCLMLPALAVSRADEPVRIFEWKDQQGVVRYTPLLERIPQPQWTTVVVMERGEDGRAFAYIEDVDGRPVLRSDPPVDGAVHKVVVMQLEPRDVDPEALELEAALLEIEAEMLAVEAELLEVEGALIDAEAATLEPLQVAQAAPLDPNPPAAPPEQRAAPVPAPRAPIVGSEPGEDRCSVARIPERTPWLSPLERLDLLPAHRLYGTRVEADGRVWQRLRLGFFPSLTEAQSVQRRLDPSFPGAWIAQVSAAERQASARTALVRADEEILSAPGEASYAIQVGALPLDDCVPQREQLASRTSAD